MPTDDNQHPSRTITLTPRGQWAAGITQGVLFRAPCIVCRQPVDVRAVGVYSSGQGQPYSTHRCRP
jgi:hypothetical protein